MMMRILWESARIRYQLLVAKVPYLVTTLPYLPSLPYLVNALNSFNSDQLITWAHLSSVQCLHHDPLSSNLDHFRP